MRAELMETVAWRAKPLVLRIICVSPDGQRADTGIVFQIPTVPKPLQRRRW